MSDIRCANRPNSNEKLASKLCLISQHTQRLITKSIPKVGSSVELETLTRTFHHPLLIFTGVKSAKFGLDFRPLSPLTRTRSETMQHVLKLRGAVKAALKAQVIALYILQIWFGLVHRTLRTRH